MDNIDYDYVEKTTKAASSDGIAFTGNMMSVVLVVSMILLIACFVMLIVVIVKLNSLSIGNNTSMHSVIGELSQSAGCVFCKTCGNQYDANEKMCPYCKTKNSM
ncbi:MAG TPA: hypothetical protein DEO82_04445 [Eubacterium sp.]|nr:hypothetical protein [Eubacterium sp.]